MGSDTPLEAEIGFRGVLGAFWAGSSKLGAAQVKLMSKAMNWGQSLVSLGREKEWSGGQGWDDFRHSL